MVGAFIEVHSAKPVPAEEAQTFLAPCPPAWASLQLPAGCNGMELIFWENSPCRLNWGSVGLPSLNWTAQKNPESSWSCGNNFPCRFSWGSARQPSSFAGSVGQSGLNWTAQQSLQGGLSSGAGSSLQLSLNHASRGASTAGAVWSSQFLLPQMIYFSTLFESIGLKSRILPEPEYHIGLGFRNIRKY